MDPTANLQEQLKISKRILADEYKSIRELASDSQRLAELVESLHDWISKGGFLPQQWQLRFNK